MQNKKQYNAVIKVLSDVSTTFLSDVFKKVTLQVKTRNVFLSSAWMEKWYEASTTKPKLVLYCKNNEVLGTCLVGEATRKKLGVSFKTALINQSGCQMSDQAWIEYNDLLCPAEYKSEFCTLLIQYLNKEGFDLFHGSMLSEASVKDCSPILPFSNCTVVKGYRAKLIENGIQFDLTKLSKNTRTQIRRSNKKLEQLYGKISVVLPHNAEETSSFFDKLSHFHIEQWGKTHQGSGFTNSSFLQHQKALLNETDLAQLIGVFAGDMPLGLCINYVFEGRVYFYCSGVNHTIASSHIKPGYSMHAALMQYYADNGFETYDFLGGDARYKQSLSNEEYNFFSLTVPLSSLKGRLYSTYQRTFKALLRLKQC